MSILKLIVKRLAQAAGVIVFGFLAGGLLIAVTFVVPGVVGNWLVPGHTVWFLVFLFVYATVLGAILIQCTMLTR